jgi:hypothetical protein
MSKAKHGTIAVLRKQIEAQEAILRALLPPGVFDDVTKLAKNSVLTEKNVREIFNLGAIADRQNLPTELLDRVAEQSNMKYNDYAGMINDNPSTISSSRLDARPAGMSRMGPNEISQALASDRVSPFVKGTSDYSDEMAAVMSDIFPEKGTAVKGSQRLADLYSRLDRVRGILPKLFLGAQTPPGIEDAAMDYLMQGQRFRNGTPTMGEFKQAGGI